MPWTDVVQRLGWIFHSHRREASNSDPLYKSPTKTLHRLNQNSHGPYKTESSTSKYSIAGL